MKQINDKQNDKQNLHQEALRSLCALQYYLSTLENQTPENKKINYALSFKLMKNIVNTIYNSIDINVDTLNYPEELLLIYHNLNKKLYFILI